MSEQRLSQDLIEAALNLVPDTASAADTPMDAAPTSVTPVAPKAKSKAATKKKSANARKVEQAGLTEAELDECVSLAEAFTWENFDEVRTAFDLTPAEAELVLERACGPRPSKRSKTMSDQTAPAPAAPASAPVAPESPGLRDRYGSYWQQWQVPSRTAFFKPCATLVQKAIPRDEDGLRLYYEAYWGQWKTSNTRSSSRPAAGAGVGHTPQKLVVAVEETQKAGLCGSAASPPEKVFPLYTD